MPREFLKDAPQQRFPIEGDELSLEEQVGLNLAMSPGKNILGRKKSTWKGLGEKEHLVPCTHFIIATL